MTFKKTFIFYDSGLVDRGSLLSPVTVPFLVELLKRVFYTSFSVFLLSKCYD